MLTVLIPSYNHEKYIVQCIAQAIRIPVDGKKIFIIDDGSTDSTVATAKQYVEDLNLDFVKIIAKQNAGLISSLNLGLSLAETEFLYLVASDDIPHAEGIAKTVAHLIDHPNCAFCVSGGFNFFSDGRIETPIYGPKHTRFFHLPPDQREVEMFIDYPSPLLLQSTVFRTEALRSISGWDPALAWDDYPIFVKLLMRFPVEGENFSFRPDINAVFYRHHGSNSYKNLKKQFLMVRQSLTLLAPPSIRDRALGRAAAFYLLLALKDLDFRNILPTIKNTTLKAKLYAAAYLPRLAIDYLTKKKNGRS